MSEPPSTPPAKKLSAFEQHFFDHMRETNGSAASTRTDTQAAMLQNGESHERVVMATGEGLLQAADCQAQVELRGIDSLTRYAIAR
jgi:hypothetical protein